MAILARADYLFGAKAFWLSTGGRRKPKTSDQHGWQWLPVAHSRVGGTITSVGMFGVQGMITFVDPLDT